MQKNRIVVSPIRGRGSGGGKGRSGEHGWAKDPLSGGGRFKWTQDKEQIALEGVTDKPFVVLHQTRET